MRILVVALFALMAADQAPSSAPATYLSEAELTSTLKTAEKTAPDMHTAPVKNADHYRINIVRRTSAQGAIAHPDGTEVHHIIDVPRPSSLAGRSSEPTNAGARGGNATIEGGQSRRVAKGDVILIPAGTPHWYKDLEGSITYLEVRFDLPK